MLNPTFPGFLGNVVVDALTERVTFERDFVETFGFFLQLHAEDTVRNSSHGKPLEYYGMRAILLVVFGLSVVTGLRADAWNDAIDKLRGGDQAGAIQLLEAAIRKEPGAVAPNVLLVEVLLGAERVDEARQAADRALASNGAAADLHRVEGDVHFRQGDIFGAEKEYKLAVKTDPKNARAVLGVARVYQSGSINGKARILIYQAHNLDPEDPAIEAALERIEGNTPASLARWEQAIKIRADEGPEIGTIARELRARVASTKRLQGKTESELASPYGHYQVPLSVERDGERATGLGITIQINDLKTQLQLDTGASGLIISSKMAERSGVERLADVDLGGIGNQGPVKGWLGYAERIRFGDLEFRNFIVRVSEKGAVTDTGGLIGTDVFSRFLVNLNFKAHRLELDALPGPLWDGQKMVDRYEGPELADFSQFLRLGHDVLVPTRISDGPAVLFLVDTGSTFSMISTNAAPAVTKLRSDPRVRIKGISGEVKMVYSAEKVTLEFAHFRQENQDLTAFDLSRFSRGAGAEITGIMGLPLLHLFRSVTIDYRDGRIKFDYGR